MRVYPVTVVIDEESFSSDPSRSLVAWQITANPKAMKSAQGNHLGIRLADQLDERAA